MIHTRRSFLQTLTLASGSTAFGALEPPAAAAPAKTKRGWCGNSRELHQLFGVSWWYNWNPNEKGETGGPEWVPMLKAGWAVDQTHFDRVRKSKNITTLLGFNEPERADQGKTTVEEALTAWPKVMELAKEKNLRLGSPAVSSDSGGGKWFASFMDGVKKQKLSCDFIAVHWYRSYQAREFVDWLKQLDKTYKLPIWVTEFNGWTANGKPSDHFSFLRDVIRFMDKAPNVERYAYFDPGAGKNGSLLEADNTLSKMGKLYAQA